MEEEIEDLVGSLRYTDSQNSYVYSCDFTDGSSDQHNSSGKETYVIACDSDDSDTTYDIGLSNSAINLYDSPSPNTETEAVVAKTKTLQVNKEASTSFHTLAYIEETFTQTSRTILELADCERSRNTLETQTSFISVSENRKVQYTVQYSDVKFSQNKIMQEIDRIKRDNEIANTYEEGTSGFYLRDIENNEFSDDQHLNDFQGGVNSKDDSNVNNESFDDSPKSDSYFEEDSLMNYDLQEKSSLKDCNSDVSEVPKSIDNDVAELYKKLSETIEIQTSEKFGDLAFKQCGTLTPLTEESAVKKDSLIDITPDVAALCKTINSSNHCIATDNFEDIGISMEIKADDRKTVTYGNEKGFKLPPIKKQMSCPNSPHLNLLFTLNTAHNLTKAETLPCLFEEKGHKHEKWFRDKIGHAAGESPSISFKQENRATETLQLPPIEGEMRSSLSHKNFIRHGRSAELDEKISINGRIRELKTKSPKAKGPWTRFKTTSCSEVSCSSRSYASRSPESRSVSPQSGSSPTDPAERGCESLCGDLLRRLRSSNWLEVSDTLDDIPRALDKFWGVITEQRTADLIRQISVHIESPRTQVARAACNTLGVVLKYTNYTKKPEFYEAVSLLLVKTGSFNRAVRRAANVALDEVVCGVELSRAVAALCVHGVGHKSPLVRCASARLLVVSVAIAGGGRELLRSRPASTASARRQTLQAMAAMLEDKSTDVRKFAERLYAMLRPLPNFEAFYLSDVDVEIATRQMKRFDVLLKTR